ncbi:hypothetical protein BDV26DRAFT_251479 [Aspergillus bertholletiae]|uniref:Uncharacterized protein n=1 Tax=Aspergillus bertholletiae TaxID=1226010 RepID=A0A5N7BQ18_9EURO|nr:hypothetical protein BDV26DRAFT_251479 [Aspergillus bertholletiae]
MVNLSAIVGILLAKTCPSVSIAVARRLFRHAQCRYLSKCLNRRWWFMKTSPRPYHHSWYVATSQAGLLGRVSWSSR